MCSHGSELIEQPVCFVGYSASDFTGSASCHQPQSHPMWLWPASVPN